MIQMGDRQDKGGVDLDDFLHLMKDLGLIPKEDKGRDKNSMELETIKADEKKRQESVKNNNSSLDFTKKKLDLSRMEEEKLVL